MEQLSDLVRTAKRTNMKPDSIFREYARERLGLSNEEFDSLVHQLIAENLRRIEMEERELAILLEERRRLLAKRTPLDWVWEGLIDFVRSAVCGL